ncbi:MAG: hypothetical protein C4322_00980, partial [Mastigocladus sp. ERB_26_1]
MGQVLAIDEVNQDWAKVRIDFTTNDRTTSSAYEAMIELSGHVMTAFDSGENEPLEKVKQYRVSRLAKVAAIKDSPAETPRKQGFN